MADSIVGMGQLIDQLAALVGYLRSLPPRQSIVQLGANHKIQSNQATLVGVGSTKIIDANPQRFYLLMQVICANDITLFVPSSQLSPSAIAGKVIQGHSYDDFEPKWHNSGALCSQEWWMNGTGIAVCHFISVAEI